MQTRAILVCFLLLPVVGTVIKPAASLRAHASSSQFDLVPIELQTLLTKGSRLYKAGRYLEAVEANLRGYRESKRLGHIGQAIRFLNNLGGSWFAVFRYRDAMEAFLEARRLSEAAGDWEMATALSINVSSLYLQMGEIPSAAEAIRGGFQQMRRAAKPAYRAQLLSQLARVTAQQGDLDQAIPIFEAAIAEADRQGDSPLMALGWNLLGYELLKKGRLDEADHALTEAYRLRRLNGNRDLDHSYRTLGLLRLKQGDAVSAHRLLDEAVSVSARNPGRVPNWAAYYLRGKARLALGCTAQAVEDFQTALQLARSWRLEVLPADAVRVGMEVELQELFSAFVDAAARLYGKRRQQALLAESFEAAEENRAASLRALIMDRGWPRRLPAAYGELLARLRTAQTSLLRNDGPELRRQVQRLRYELTEMEAAAGLDYGVPYPDASMRGLLEATRRTLGENECLLSFHLGGEASWRWAVTRGGAELRRLAPRAQIEQRAAEFNAAVMDGSPALVEQGRSLYRELFGNLGERARTRPRWMLAVDGALFRLPAAALVAGAGSGGPVFLIERHSLLLVPSAHMLLSRATPQAGTPGGFVGVGDPIYNMADPRWSYGRRPRPNALELPRLAASAGELRHCAAAWSDARAVLLQGAAASRQGLAAAIEKHPAIVHVAAHVLAAREPGRGGLIALSLQPSGDPELVGASEIASWRGSSRLVVLSGCSSGAGAVRPGAGLMGLTRAWLAAGAEAVAASFWPTPDESSGLFLSFYRHYRRLGGVSPEIALQQAQIDMLHSQSWRAAPRYWAAYFLAGKG